MSFSTELKLLETYSQLRNTKSLPVSTERVFLSSVNRRVAAFAHRAPYFDVAKELTHIVDISAPTDELESDGSTDVTQRLIDLLKESGDKLNEKIKKDSELLSYLQNTFSYTQFESLVSAFMNRVLPTNKVDKKAEKLKIAWTFELTSRLSALDLHPMNRTMGFGAQYVHQHFGQWIQQHGGWENAFNRDETDELE